MTSRERNFFLRFRRKDVILTKGIPLVRTPTNGSVPWTREEYRRKICFAIDRNVSLSIRNDTPSRPCARVGFALRFRSPPRARRLRTCTHRFVGSAIPFSNGESVLSRSGSRPGPMGNFPSVRGRRKESRTNDVDDRENRSYWRPTSNPIRVRFEPECLERKIGRGRSLSCGGNEE